MPAPKLSVITAVTILAACTPRSFGWPDGPGAEIRGYRASFAAAAGDELVERVERPQLRRRALNAGALWLGDHHRHARLHALHTELLDELVRDGAPMVLCLEAVGVQDQRWVDAYLRGRIEMRELRRHLRARWSGSWLDDPDLDPWYFRALLAFAREHAVPVKALEPTPRLPLAQRDARIARAVADARLEHPDRLLVVVVGQTHLLGQGDVVRRSEVGGLVVGGLPTEPLLEPGPTERARGAAWRSDQGVYWFDEMFGG